MIWLTATEYLCHKWPWIRSLWRNQHPVFPHSWLITGLVTKVTRPDLVERELFALPEYPRSPPIFSGFLLAQSYKLCMSNRINAIVNHWNMVKIRFWSRINSFAISSETKVLSGESTRRHTGIKLHSLLLASIISLLGIQSSSSLIIASYNGWGRQGCWFIETA